MNLEERKLLKKKRTASLEGNKNAISSACITLADYYFREERFEEAINAYKDAATIYKELQLLLEFARAHRMIGEAYSFLMNFDSALKHQNIHLNIAKQENNQLELQRAFATLGNTYLTIYNSVDSPDKLNLSLAQSSFIKSLKICESLTGIELREHKDMLARLLANLGVVHECLENIEKSLSLVEKSINICKKYDLFEQLERGYAFLGSLYTRQANFNKAVLHYNLAIDVAGRLDDKVNLTCTSLFAKAEIMINLADYTNAKNILLKAYKMKTSNNILRENIEHSLKVVAAMCYTEETLIVTGDNDHKSRKDLFEKMGDGASDLKTFPKAIEYYLKMLKESELCGETGKALCPAYVSLAQTYKDNKQYDLAVTYFQKEYSVSEEKNKDTQTTLFNIAECMELSKKSVYEIEKIYNKARADATRCSESSYLEGRVITRLIAFYRKHSMESKIDALEKQLRSTNYSQSESESDNSEIEVTTNIGDDICIDDITDNSDNSDTEDLSKPRSTRGKSKGFAVKKNAKGETQLHTAAITKNLTLVRKLVEQGHPVNIRDNAGWLPIHEACNLGHKDIVEYLLESGASINDRGGMTCNGVTPLHDAAYNGHLEIIEMLLDRGASATAKTTDGETPLHILKHWQIQNEPLGAIRQNFYETLVARMTRALEKAGQSGNVKVNRNKHNTALVSEDADSHFPSTSGIARAQHYNLNDLTRLDSDSDSDAETTTSDYKEVMQNIRKRMPESQQTRLPKANVEKKSAMLNAEEVCDDWLEDDLGSGRPQKKRKKEECEEYFNLAQKRSAASNESKTNKKRLERKSSTKSIENAKPVDQIRYSKEVTRVNTSPEYHRNALTEKQSSFNNDCVEIPDGFFEVDFENEQENANDNVDNDSNSSSNCFEFESLNVSKKRKRKSQISLIEAGFTRQLSDKSPTFNRDKIGADKHVHKQQASITNFGLVRTNSSSSQSSNISSSADSFNVVANSVSTIQMHTIDIRIDKTLLRISVPSANYHELTMKWLKAEAARRYFKKEFIEPILELQTQDGAELDEDDLLSTLFLPGSVRGEAICAKIVKWNLPSLLDRYREACANSNSDSRDEIVDVIKLDDTNLDLSNKIEEAEDLSPLFKALKHQRNLLVLNLSSTDLSDEGFLVLCTTFPTLSNLETLDVSSNCLGENALKGLSDTLQESSSAILPHLAELNLSFNCLENGAYKYLTYITKFLKLRSLTLASCNFTDKIFDVFGNRGLELNLEHVENLDISFNELNQEAIEKFLSFLDPSKVVSLDVASNLSVTSEGLVRKMVASFEKCDKLSLKTLNLERCHVTDEEILELLRILRRAQHFESINLSYNCDLTAITLRRLFEHSPSLVNVYIKSVDISRDFDSCTLTDWTIGQNVERRLKSVTLPLNFEENACEISYFRNLWDNCYSHRAKIKIGKYLTELSVCDN